MVGAVLHFSPETRDPVLPLLGIDCPELVDLTISSTDGERLGVLFTGGYHSTLRGGREGEMERERESISTMSHVFANNIYQECITVDMVNEFDHQHL